MPWRFGLALPLACLWPSVAAARERPEAPFVAVVATDVRTGERIQGLRCALVAARTRETLARFGDELRTPGPMPTPGDRVYIFCRGYDLAHRDLAAVPARLAVALEPCTRRCRLRAVGAETGFRMQVSLTTEGRWTRSPILDRFEVASRGAGVDLRWPRGMRARLLVEAERGLCWPAVFEARDGAEHLLHVEQPRALALLTDPGGPELRPGAFEFLPDMCWQPPVEPERVDAYRWALNRAGWLRDGLAPSGGVLAVLPDVPFHCFCLLGGLPAYRHVTLGDHHLDLRAPPRLQVVAGRPSVDGEPAREGTLLAPGRLDASAITALWQLRATLPGVCLRLGDPGVPWRAPALPPAEWLTAWHPDAGLCHLRWTRHAPPVGQAYRGVLLVLVPSGWTATGHCSAFPVWKGTGAVRTVPPDGPLRRTFPASGSVRFAGLPPGCYGVDLAVDLVRTAPGRHESVRETLEVDLLPGSPYVAVELPLRD